MNTGFMITLTFFYIPVGKIQKDVAFGRRPKEKVAMKFAGIGMLHHHIRY